MEVRSKDVEASFRSSLEDVLLVVKKLAPFCASAEEMCGMIALALENDGQNKLLYALMMKQDKK